MGRMESIENPPSHRVKGYSGTAARRVDKAQFPSEADLDRKLAGRGRRYH